MARGYRSSGGERSGCPQRCHESPDGDAAEHARLNFLDHLPEAAATALARAVGSGRADHNGIARMAGHLCADTAGALGSCRESSARRRGPAGALGR